MHLFEVRSIPRRRPKDSSRSETATETWLSSINKAAIGSTASRDLSHVPGGPVDA